MSISQRVEVRRMLAARARAILESGYHCSESVLLGVGPEVVADWDPKCLRLANGFGGGLGGSEQELCGALAGGVMVIGALLGREELREDTLSQALSREYLQRFEESFGETRCGPLRRNVVLSRGGLGNCGVVVERATGVLVDILLEAGVWQPGDGRRRG